MSPLDSLRSPFVRRDWVRVKAGSATAIPPHSVVLITASTITNGEVVYTVSQQSSTFAWSGILITGPFEIGASTNYEGIATDANTPCLAAYSGSPAVGDGFGPVSGSFLLSENYYGFKVVGSTTTSGGVNVVPVKWEGIPGIIGKIDDASVSAGSSCTVSVHVGSSYQTDSTWNVTALNRGTDLTMLSTPYCRVTNDNGVPILNWVAC